MRTNILSRTPSYAAHSLRGFSLALAVVALGAIPQLANAQGRQVAQLASSSKPASISPVEDVNAATAIMYTVRNTLRDLVMAQETYWRARQSYASDVGALTSFHAATGVTVHIMHAGVDGWAARAAYGNGEPAVGVRSCVVWVGGIDPAQRPATDIEHKIYPEAETSCDGDGYDAKTEWAAAGQSYMTYALQKLIVNETRFYAFHQRYTALGTQLDPFIWDHDVAVEIVTATSTGWAARATFSPAPGKTCIVRHGTLTAAELPAASAAEFMAATADKVSCDHL
jgi:hypothetical protein